MIKNCAILVLLLLINGFFAMAELAILSARRSRLRQMAEEGRHKGARRALDLAGNPSSFLSIVQVGVTLVSVLLGAFSGTELAGPFGAYLNGIEGISPYGEWIAMAVTVAFVTYLSLVIGELVPKRIGLAYAEPIAVRVAGFMRGFALLAAPVVWFLGVSTEIVLKILGLKSRADSVVTEEDVRGMIEEGAKTGALKPAEKNMLESVMRLSDRTVAAFMTPRVDMVWLAVEDGPEENLRIVKESGYSRFPLVKGDLKEVLGIVRAKDLLRQAASGQKPDFLGLLRPPLVVPETASVLRLLEQFKQTGQHVAIVVDEYGSLEGMISIVDILQAVIGEIHEAGKEKGERPIRRADGTWLADGMTSIDEVESLIGVKGLRDGETYHTLAGFMIDRLGRVPAVGDFFEWGGARFEVMDMDGRRIDMVLITPPSGEEVES